MLDSIGAGGWPAHRANENLLVVQQKADCLFPSDASRDPDAYWESLPMVYYRPRLQYYSVPAEV